MGVDAAVERVRTNLKESFTDWDVTASELKDNNQALKELAPAERNEAVSRLSDDELQHWADETKGLNSPLNADDRRDLLNMLAQDLDPQQLARAAKAFGTQDMADAVSAHGSPQQKAAFIQALQSGATADLQIKPGLGVTTSSYGNDNAKAVAQVLASLKDSPKEFSQALNGLEQAGKLDDVMKTAAGQTTMTMTMGGSAYPSVSFDDKHLQDILAGVSKLPQDDLSTRTSAFKAAAPALAAMQGATGTLADPAGYNAATAQRTADALGKVLTRDQATAAGLVNTPAKPANASMDQNVQDAQAHGFPQDLGWFYNQVRNKGPWDYKQQGAQYQNFGNFNFGLTAAAMGIPESVALRGAGWAQQRAGTSEPANGNPWDLNDGPYGDDPADQTQIKAGYDYYNSGLWRIWND